MLVAFGADWSFELIAAIWQAYLLTMIAPSLILGKVGVKESIALFVLATLNCQLAHFRQWTKDFPDPARDV